MSTYWLYQNLVYGSPATDMVRLHDVVDKYVGETGLQLTSSTCAKTLGKAFPNAITRTRQINHRRLQLITGITWHTWTPLGVPFQIHDILTNLGFVHRQGLYVWVTSWRCRQFADIRTISLSPDGAGVKVTMGGQEVALVSHGVPEILHPLTWESVHALGQTVKGLVPCSGLPTGDTSRAIMFDQVTNAAGVVDVFRSHRCSRIVPQNSVSTTCPVCLDSRRNQKKVENRQITAARGTPGLAQTSAVPLPLVSSPNPSPAPTTLPPVSSPDPSLATITPPLVPLPDPFTTLTTLPPVPSPDPFIAPTTLSAVTSPDASPVPTTPPPVPSTDPWTAHTTPPDVTSPHPSPCPTIPPPVPSPDTVPAPTIPPPVLALDPFTAPTTPPAVPSPDPSPAPTTLPPVTSTDPSKAGQPGGQPPPQVLSAKSSRAAPPLQPMPSSDNRPVRRSLRLSLKREVRRYEVGSRKRKAANVVQGSCGCPNATDDGGPYYTHLGTAKSVNDLKTIMRARSGLVDTAIRLEIIHHTKKQGKTTTGCPIPKWIVRRSSSAEKLLLMCRVRPGHTCDTAVTVVNIVLWDGVPQDKASALYDYVANNVASAKHGTGRRCGRNEDRTCACQGTDGQAGASHSFGCSWILYHSACKYGRSRPPIQKFKLEDKSQEPVWEEHVQALATELNPILASVAPDCYRNMTAYEDEANACRLGKERGRPFAGVTACMDFCAHAHKDSRNMHNGCTMVLTLTKHRDAGPAEDEQLHVLPCYILGMTDEFGNAEGQSEKVESGYINVLAEYKQCVRIRTQPPASKLKKLQKPKYKDVEMDNSHVLEDKEVGGVALALTHGSLLFEVAKYEVHATTALKKPNRYNPTRISLVFFQHGGLNYRDHGIAETALKTANWNKTKKMK